MDEKTTKPKKKLAVTEYLESLAKCHPDTQKTMVRHMVERRMIGIPSHRMLKEIGLPTNYNPYKARRFEVRIDAKDERYRNELIIALAHLGLTVRLLHTSGFNTVIFETERVEEI